MAADRALEVLEPFAGDAAGLKSLIETVEVTVRAEDLEEGFTNDDIVRGGVIMKFLMPFFQKMTAALLDVMPVHDVQDLIANALPLSATADCSQGQAEQWPDSGLGPVDVSQLRGEAVLGIGQFAWFGIVIALPG